MKEYSQIFFLIVAAFVTIYCIYDLADGVRVCIKTWRREKMKTAVLRARIAEIKNRRRK